MSLIQPRTLKGFRDYLPEAMIAREWIIETARRVYRSYGFRPIDTPALEYLEILTGKGSDETDKQLYKFQDHGGRDVGLRFDLTVPLARFVAQHSQELGLPFKRYHIATVWRGENTQAGRYREFMQCDFDTIGVTDLTADIEMVLVINDLFTALGIERFTIRVNHRGILNELLRQQGFGDKSVAVLRALDKLGKIGIEGVGKELRDQISLPPEQIAKFLDIFVTESRTFDALEQIKAMFPESSLGRQNVAEVMRLFGAADAAGVPSRRIQFDASITRGLDYYTGIVVETQLDELPTIGSVASGGRYDNLAGLYTKEKLPGVGASLGLDRLLAALETLGRLPTAKTPAPVLICMFPGPYLNGYLKLAGQLRAAGIGVEVYPEAKKLGKQLQYADKQGFRVAVIIGGDEFANGQCQVKNLAAQTSVTVPYNGADATSLVEAIRLLLNG
ncbi:MAG TPA: histidine--tRNA ligase [Lacipirellulaceae bacterium]|nr:histidine--tRNA ligase [Lacipirellulaceae bacterium]